MLIFHNKKLAHNTAVKQMPYRRQLTLVARFMTSLKGYQVHLARSVSKKKNK